MTRNNGIEHFAFSRQTIVLVLTAQTAVFAVIYIKLTAYSSSPFDGEYRLHFAPHDVICLMHLFAQWLQITVASFCLHKNVRPKREMISSIRSVTFSYLVDSSLHFGA